MNSGHQKLRYAELYKYLASAVGWRLVGFLLALVLWSILSAVTQGALPYPSEVAAEFGVLSNRQDAPSQSARGPGLWAHLAATTARAGVGLALAFAFFVPLGIAVGAGRISYQATTGVIELGRSTPGFMLLLVLVSLKLSGEHARVGCIVFACGALLADFTATAMRNVPPESLEVLKLMRAGMWSVFWKAIWIPILLNALLPALRIGIGMAVIVALVVETLLIPETGLGVLVTLQLGRANLAGSMALVLVSGAVSWVGNFLLLLLSDWLWWVLYGRPLPVSE